MSAIIDFAMISGWSVVLLLGRDLCGDRILRPCLQKGPATALANYAHTSLARPPAASKKSQAGGGKNGGRREVEG